jgi:hypothetical protein
MGLINLIRTGRWSAPVVAPVISTGEVLPPMSAVKSKPFTALNDRERAAIKNSQCPDCGSKEFIQGPSGGMTVNVECAGCGSKFNVGSINGTVFGERIS